MSVLKNIVSFRYPLCYEIAQLLIIEPNNNLIDNGVLLSEIENNQQGRIIRKHRQRYL